MKTLLRLFVGLVISIISFYLIQKMAVIVSDIINARHGLMVLTVIGWLAWAAFLGKLIDMVVINVPFQRAWVTLNLFTKTQRIVRQGYVLKYPWEQVQKDKEIDLLRHIILIEEKGFGGEKTGETYTSADSTPLYAKWSLLISPDEGDLETYIKFRREDIEAQFRAFTNQHLSDMCGRMDASEIMKSKTKMADELALLHENKRSELEELYGVKAGKFVLGDVDQDPEVLKAKQVALEMKSDGEAAQELVTLAGVDASGNNRLDFATAMRMVMLRNKNSGVEQKIFTVEGLEGIQHLSVGGMHGMPGSAGGGGGGNGGGGKKQRNQGNGGNKS
jgi:hypothetical protein